MSEPSYLKKQSKLNQNYDKLERNDNKLTTDDTSKPFPNITNNQYIPRNMEQPKINPQMPKPFNTPNFNNQNKFSSNNPFNNKKF